MQVQIASGGSSSVAATLNDLAFSPCSEGAYRLTQDWSGNAIVREILDGGFTTAKSGDVRVLLRVRSRVPLSSYNVSGVVQTNVPEFQCHAVMTLPKIVVAALQGTLTTTPSDLSETGTVPAMDVAQYAIAEAIAILATMMTNQPANSDKIRGSILTSPWFKGLMGVCPLNYATSDLGSERVLPPPQRS